MEAIIRTKYEAIAPVLDERARRLWAAAESRAIGYGGDAIVSAAMGPARATIRAGRAELEQGVTATGRVRQPGAGRPKIEKTQLGVKKALEARLDRKRYPTGGKISKTEIKGLALKKSKFHGEWNYELFPRKLVN